jgi:hypothetical protein
MRFELTPKQIVALEEWRATKNLNKYSGAIGGRFTFSFTPTSLGTVVKVSDAMEQKDTIDLSDYDSF